MAFLWSRSKATCQTLSSSTSKTTCWMSRRTLSRWSNKTRSTSSSTSTVKGSKKPFSEGSSTTKVVLGHKVEEKLLQAVRIDHLRDSFRRHRRDFQLWA